MNQFDRFLFRYFPFSESITFNFYRKYITTKKIVKLILKCIWFLKFFWPGHFKIIWPAMCPPLKQYFQVSFFPFCSPTGRLLKKMNHNFFPMFFSKVFKKEEKKILFVVVRFSMQEKKDLLYNYIYYINTYLDKTIYKSGQSFKKKSE